MPATLDKPVARPRCATCAHLRLRADADNRKRRELGYENTTHWCEKLDMPTLPRLLRCGGDDYEPAVSPS
jgi:hypothetical protein